MLAHIEHICSVSFLSRPANSPNQYAHKDVAVESQSEGANEDVAAHLEDYPELENLFERWDEHPPDLDAPADTHEFSTDSDEEISELLCRLNVEMIGLE